MRNPGFVTLNGHRIKVQRWHQDSEAITFTSVIHGEKMGNDIVNAAKAARVSLAIDEDTTLAGTARLLDRRASGVGPTAVVRLEVRFTVDGESGSSVELTPDQKLDVILAELRALRREVDDMRGTSTSMPMGGITPPAPGKTMIDFEIPLDDDEH